MPCSEIRERGLRGRAMPRDMAQSPMRKIEMHDAKAFGIAQRQPRRMLLAERARNHLCEICQRIFLLHHASIASSTTKGAGIDPVCESDVVLGKRAPRDPMPL